METIALYGAESKEINKTYVSDINAIEKDYWR